MNYVIIVAGGKGLRMGSELPKQFLPVGGRPVLMRTIERFHDFQPDMDIIVVLPASQQDYWKELCRQNAFTIPHRIATGGATRFDSVKNGLALIPDDATGLVGIHDGVRPFPAAEVIGRCYRTAEMLGAAVPVVPVVETLRHINGTSVPRSEYRLVQTPQVFSIRLLKQAYRQSYNELFTDDASVVEYMGLTVNTVEGNRENIKITTPFDLIVAEAILQQEKEK